MHRRNYGPGVSKPLPALDLIAEARRQWVAHGWAGAADGMAVVTSVMRVQQLLLAELDDVLRPFGLTFARYEVLMLLHFSRRGALPLGKIGGRLQVAPGAVTNAVDRLEDDGLVRRQPHPKDRRTTLASITSRGRHRALTATEQLNAVFENLTLTTTEERRLVALLGHLRAGGGDSVV
jgi:DNA-binding MarR family transcriptional regulator